MWYCETRQPTHECGEFRMGEGGGKGERRGEGLGIEKGEGKEVGGRERAERAIPMSREDVAVLSS